MGIRDLAPLALVCALAACSGNPLNNGGGGGGGGGGGVTVAPAIAKNLRAITYDPTGVGSLRVDLAGLTASAQTATFVRDASLDVAGYRAFTYQETGLQRTHLALVANSLRGNLQAGVVSDGGQFNRHFAGGSYSRIGIDAYSRPVIGTAPETGQFSYAGSYAGVFVTGDATHPSLPPGLQPHRPLRTEGDALFNANFANNLVNGGVDNRWLLNDAGARIDLNGDGVVNASDQLASLSFPATTIDNNGQFLGTVEIFNSPGATPGGSIGDIGGLFGGAHATDIAGAIVINPIPGDSNVWEYGVFNLPRCDTAGASALCVPR